MIFLEDSLKSITDKKKDIFFSWEVKNFFDLSPSSWPFSKEVNVTWWREKFAAETQSEVAFP